MTFALDIGKFASRFGIDADVAARKVMLDIQRDVMKATPVDTGMLRSSWFLGLGSPAVAPTNSDSVLSGFKWGATVWLSNNLPYAHFIEFGGSKVKAPAGMLRVTVARYQAQMGRFS